MKKIFPVMKVLILSYLITGVLLLLAAFIMFKMKLGESAVRLFVMVIYGISTIIAGLAYGKIKGEKRAINGAFIGMLFFVVLSVLSFIINKGFYEDMKKAIISFVICITGGIIGGIMS